MLNIIKNDWHRMKEQKAYLIVSIMLTVCCVAMAVLLTGKLQVKSNIAIVGECPAISDGSGLNIEHLDKEPEMSQLVQNRYDAVITFNKDGSYNIETLRGDEFRQALDDGLHGINDSAKESSKIRNVGTNIIGFMLMFILMQGVLYGRLFAEDKEKHIMERVAISPIKFSAYMLGHILFMFILIFIPSFSVLIVCSMAGIETGFSLWQFAVLIGVLAMLSTCFSVCLNSFFCAADTANMVGSCIVVISSILGGSFYDMGKSSSFLGRMLYAIPQKGFMNFVNAWEKQIVDTKDIMGLVYVIICSGVFIAIGAVKTKRDYVYNRGK